MQTHLHSRQSCCLACAWNATLFPLCWRVTLQESCHEEIKLLRSGMVTAETQRDQGLLRLQALQASAAASSDPAMQKALAQDSKAAAAAAAAAQGHASSPTAEDKAAAATEAADESPANAGSGASPSAAGQEAGGLLAEVGVVQVLRGRVAELEAELRQVMPSSAAHMLACTTAVVDTHVTQQQACNNFNSRYSLPSLSVCLRIPARRSAACSAWRPMSWSGMPAACAAATSPQEASAAGRAPHLVALCQPRMSAGLHPGLRHTPSATSAKTGRVCRTLGLGTTTMGCMMATLAP